MNYAQELKKIHERLDTVKVMAIDLQREVTDITVGLAELYKAAKNMETKELARQALANEQPELVYEDDPELDIF